MMLKIRRRSSLEPLRIDEPRGGSDGLFELLRPPMPKPGCWRMECTTEGSRSCNFFESGKWIDGACRDVDVAAARRAQPSSSVRQPGRGGASWDGAGLVTR